MKSLSVNKGLFKSVVSVPPSKSYANRALILASLSPVSFSLQNIPSATDVTILLDCLKQIGLKIIENDGALIVENSFPECESGDQVLKVGEGGTTARFLATMLLLGKCEYRLILGERLKERPWIEFITLARSLNATARLENDTLIVQGPIGLPHELLIDASKTTQFATAFKLLTVKHDMKVIPQGMESSQSYWLMNESLIKDFKKKSFYSVPLDWSSASYPMAFAALNQRIKFPGLKADSFQADSKLFGILSSLGSTQVENNELVIQPMTKAHDLHLDVSDCLDLVPTLSYLLAHTEGHHTLIGFQNLIHKESNRLEEVIKLLKIFAREVQCGPDILKIVGKKELLSKKVDLEMPNDHRMVMAGTLFLLHHCGGTISPVDAVTKSFPHFFSLLDQ